MTTLTRVALATPSAAFEQRLRSMFVELNGDLRRWHDELLTAPAEQAVAEIASKGMEVVALGPGVAVDQALAIARVFDREHPEINVLLVAERTPQVLELAMQAGVRNVIAPDADDAAVREAFSRALESAARRRENLVGPADAGGPRGRVICCVSPKGGSGKTTVATNLAYGLAQVAPNDVAIVDLDLQFGDVSSALQLVPEHTIVDAARVGERSGGRIDATTLKVFLTPHPGQLYALCGSEDPAEGESVKPERVSEVVRLLADEFRYVVLDTSAGISEHTLTAMEHATDILLLCAMDVPSVRSLHKLVTALERLGMTTQQRHFVLNRADSRVGLDVRDVEATVGLPVNVELPSSRQIPLSMNQGSPVLESEPRSGVAKQFRELVGLFAEVSAQRGGLFARRRDS
jgi:pilus assembly protein CpaE